MNARDAARDRREEAARQVAYGADRQQVAEAFGVTSATLARWLRCESPLLELARVAPETPVARRRRLARSMGRTLAHNAKGRLLKSRR